MASDGHVRLDQLFQQRMAKDLDAHLRPLITLTNKQVLPIARAQGLPQAIGCLQQQRVFVEHGERVAQGTTLLANALASDFLRLQLVQTAFAATKAQPAQAIEKIMQPLPHRALLAAENKALVGFSGGQGLLWHKGHRRARWPRAGIERGMQSPPVHHLLRHLLPDAGPRR